MFDLKTKVAIVTGGNGGIGLGMARGLARAGATVVVAARDAGKSAEAVRELQSLGSEAFAVEVDVCDEASVAAMVAGTVERCGRLDILVNNAGINIRKPAQELSFDEWRQVIDTNLGSAFLCARAAYPHMKQAGRRQGHQHRLDAVDLRRVLRAGLWRQQGRRGAAHQVAGGGLGKLTTSR